MTKECTESLLVKDVESFIQSLESVEGHHEKLERMLDYIQLQLSHGEIKPLNRFWKMRHFCLQLFKKDLPFSKRLKLWDAYCQIVAEISLLKENLNEKNGFHKKEIEKAIDSIEQDLEKFDQILLKAPEIDIPRNCPCHESHLEFYQKKQRELNLFNLYSKQLNALKDEILVLEIPYKEKQNLLDRVHEVSDQVFPKKRELLSLISKKYQEDIHHFIKLNFEKKELKLPLFDLKDQIKALQAFSKILSLNVGAFSQSREKLSACWDQIRHFEKSQKKVKEQQKQTFNENEMRLFDRIQALKENKVNLSKKDFDLEVEKIDEDLKKKSLLKNQRKKLKDFLTLIDENAGAKENLSEEEEHYTQIQREILNIQDKAKYWDYFTLANEYKRILARYQEAKLLDIHQNKILRRLFSLKELLMEKLLEEVENSVDIEELSKQIEEFRKEMNEDLDQYRRALNTSNQSIEKAMLYNELLTQTKLKLSQFNKKIKPTFSA